jgi:hypothetical protein
VTEASSSGTFEVLLARLEAAVDALEKTRSHDEPVLGVGDVRARYGLADDRTARALMHEAGAFRVGGRLFVRRCDLERLEAGRIERPRQHAGRSPSPARSTGRRHEPDLEPGFWRQ